MVFVVRRDVGVSTKNCFFLGNITTLRNHIARFVHFSQFSYHYLLITLADMPIMLKYTQIAARNLEFRPMSVFTQEPKVSKVSGTLSYWPT